MDHTLWFPSAAQRVEEEQHVLAVKGFRELGEGRGGKGKGGEGRGEEGKGGRVLSECKIGTGGSISF